MLVLRLLNREMQRSSKKKLNTESKKQSRTVLHKGFNLVLCVKIYESATSYSVVLQIAAVVQFFAAYPCFVNFRTKMLPICTKPVLSCIFDLWSIIYHLKEKHVIFTIKSTPKLSL